MRIAIVSDGVHPYVIGGMQRHTFYLCKFLASAGHKITLFHYNDSDLDINALEVFTESERMNIESIVLDFPASDRWPGHYVRASYKYSELVYEKIGSRLREFDFIYTKGFAGWKLIEEKQKAPADFPPVSVKFHGYEMFQKQADFKSYLKSFVLRRPVKWISRHADFVFSYGSKITGIIRSLGVRNEKIVEIPAGIEENWIRNEAGSPSEKRIFTYLGRYERRKGIEELNLAIQKLLDKKAEFTFNFIGPFTEDQKLHAENVIYHGSITDNLKLRSILDGTDFLVCPSWSEGMPNVILEGMARSCAVIATDVGAVSIMLDQSNGFLIEPGDVRILTNTLIKAIETNNDQVFRFKQSSLQKIKTQFKYDYIINKFATFIQQNI